MRMKYAMRKAARHSYLEGTLTSEQYKTVMSVIRHPMQKGLDGNMVDVIAYVEKFATDEMGKQGWSINWDTVIQWFKDNWLKVLQAIAAIVTIIVLI
jgi:hypothetical protein